MKETTLRYPGHIEKMAVLREIGRFDENEIMVGAAAVRPIDLTGTHSMARTTGYTATAAARMLIEGLYKEPGIAPPELIGRHKEPCDFMLRHLRERQVVCEEEVTGSPVKTLDRRFAGESKQESR